MKRSLMEILACPRCKYHPLDLTVKREDKDDVIEGTIACPRCKTNYPIEDGIPNMIIPDE